ncbi:hypothetical protein K8B66_28160 [Burkholderia contaminans]|nr:hypothetical protein K8B66_28160 [Burkholderia contaminans]
MRHGARQLASSPARAPSAQRPAPESPRAREPESPRAREPESPRAREPESPRAREPESPRAREPESPRAREPQHPSTPAPQHPSTPAPQHPSARSASSSITTTITIQRVTPAPNPPVVSRATFAFPPSMSAPFKHVSRLRHRRPCLRGYSRTARCACAA